MFGLGTGELLIILTVALVLFGAKRLPDLGRGLGEGMRGFRDALKGKEPEDQGSDSKNDDSSSSDEKAS